MKTIAMFSLLMLVALTGSTLADSTEWKMNMVSDGSVQPNEKIDIWIQGLENAEAYVVFYTNYNISAPFDQQKEISAISLEIEYGWRYE